MTKVVTVLTDIHSVRLSHLVPQEQICKLLMKGMAKALAVKSGKIAEKDVEKIRKRVELKFSQFAVQSSDIKQRYMCLLLDDYNAALKKKSIVEDGKYADYDITFPIYDNLIKNHTHPEGLALPARMELYRQQAEKHIRHLYSDSAEKPDHIIHVTSTGYFDPNPVDTIITEKEWYDVDVTNFYHRACNAPISAIRMANAVLTASSSSCCELPKKRIDLVHSELFSAHIRLIDDHPANVVIMSSFSDSFLRYSIRTYTDICKTGMGGLKILAFKNMTIPDSSSVVVWKVSEPAFHFSIDLIKYSKHIKKNLKEFIYTFFHDNGMDFMLIKDKILFVIQASTAYVLKQMAKELNLADEQITFSKNILYENGYLSSGAIPFMCKQIIDNRDIPSGKIVFCIGYAQGITLSGMLLEKL
ncbi:MAG: hypothetical protein FDX21_01945 [Chlorobium sp.]|nr:MAG: hypothetical protein FDX21_01945 [Chlorobium sp.]